MNTSYFIATRLIKSRGKTFSRLIIRIAIVAIALSMAVMIIGTSLINGFQSEIEAKMYGFWGNIQISNLDLNNSFENEPISKNQPFLKELRANPSISHIQQFATKPGIIKTREYFEGVLLKGIGADFNWDFLQKYIVAGEHPILTDTTPSWDIMVSQSAVDNLSIGLGDSILLHFIDASSLRTKWRKLRVSGIYSTGLEEYDKRVAMVDIRQIQKLNGWEEDQIGGFEVYVTDLSRLDEINNMVNEVIGLDLLSRTIREFFPDIFDWLELQGTNEEVIVGLMLIVAIINMITALLILILERTNMIGTLKALGASDWDLRKIFLLNASYIIILGLFWGNVIGFGICLIQEYFGIVQLDEKTYYVSYAPVAFNWLWLISLNVLTFLICLIALIIPSWLVSRISPVQAIRFD